MRTLVLVTIMLFSMPASAEPFDESPYGLFDSTSRQTDERRADRVISPPPADADEATVTWYYDEVEQRDKARWRLQRDAEFRLHQLEERQEELEREVKRREVWPGSEWP